MDFEHWDADKMLRVYIHDYLVKKGMHVTADILDKEANISHDEPVLESPDGFLHEWWTAFSAVFESRLEKELVSSSQEAQITTGSGSIGAPPRFPSTSMIGLRPEQFQASSSFNKMLPPPAAGPMPPRLNVEPDFHDLIRSQQLKFLAGTSSNHLLQDVARQTQKQVFKDSGIGIHIGRNVPRDPLDVVQRRMQPLLDEPQQTNTNEALNLAPLNSWPVNDQVLTSFLQAPNYSQQRQVLTTQNPEAVVAQVPACSPKSQTFTVPGNATKCNNHYTKIPETESSKKDMQDQVLTSFLQAPNYPQQRQVLTTQNPEAVFAQVSACSPKSQTFTVPENAIICNNHDTKIPETESSKKDMQDQVLTSFLQAPNYPQQRQMLTTQNPEAVFAKVPACSPKSQTFTVPGNAAKCNNHDTKIPETESSKMDMQDQVLTSFSQAPNYPQQRQLLTTQNPEAVFAQVPACSPKSQAFTIPGNATKCNNHDTKIPETESSKKDMQMVDQIRDQQPQAQSQNIEMVDQIRDQEPQAQSQNVEAVGQIRDQQPLAQSQNVEKRKKRKNTTVSLTPGESAQGHVDVADGKPVDENVESFLSFDDDPADHKMMPFSNLKHISATINKNENEGFSFEEVSCLHSSANKVLSCHFSSDGNFLASVGHEKKVYIWNMETFDCFTPPEEHSNIITDVRFAPISTFFATSSFDRTIKLWDAARPTRPLVSLDGHGDEQIMSLDFHPRKPEVLVSCDSNDVLRLWDVRQKACLHRSKGGGSKQARFQPLFGKLLASASANYIRVVDFETNKLVYELVGHEKDVLSICWDLTGTYIASVSEDSARVWSATTDGKCISVLQSNGNKFQSCVFHPAYLNLLIIGGYETFELWSPTENSKTLTVPAHKGLIAGLAASPSRDFIASASHDHSVKLWR